VKYQDKITEIFKYYHESPKQLGKKIWLYHHSTYLLYLKEIVNSVVH